MLCRLYPYEPSFESIAIGHARQASLARRGGRCAAGPVGGAARHVRAGCCWRTERGASLPLTLVSFDPWSQAYRACWKGQRDGYRFESIVDPFFLDPFFCSQFNTSCTPLNADRLFARPKVIVHDLLIGIRADIGIVPDVDPRFQGGFLTCQRVGSFKDFRTQSTKA